MYSFSQTEYWGMTNYGGTGESNGTIYKTDSLGDNQQVVYSFKANFATNPFCSNLVEANGKLYGMTASGGSNMDGNIFEYIPGDSSFTNNTFFNYATTSQTPCGSLTKINNGKMYGTTAGNGTNDYGTIFEFDPSSNIITTKYVFTNQEWPQGNLTLASNNFYYGLTPNGGNGYGLLYKYDADSNIYHEKIIFDSLSGPQSCYGNLLNASNGKLYGLSSRGGVNGSGTLFEFDPANDSLVVVFNFGGQNGEMPFGSLIEKNGILYGLTASGGAFTSGVIFEFNFSSAIFQKKYDFKPYSSSYHFNTFSELFLASNNRMYALTGGGEYNLGAIVEYNYLNDSLILHYSFPNSLAGQFPGGNLMEASNGKLYGMTTQGGASPYNGVLFEFDTLTSTVTKKIDFNNGRDGQQPVASLFKASDGLLYGTTYSGGIHGKGTIFSIDPVTNIFTKKFDLNDSIVFPRSSFVEYPQGILIGASCAGASTDSGTIFKYDIAANSLTVLHSFTRATGYWPIQTPIIASDGKLYGVTASGGAYSYGVLYSLDLSTNIYTELYEFDITNGGYTQSGVMQASNGKIYGVTRYGGLTDEGVLFEFDPVLNLYTKKFDFGAGISGNAPTADLVEFTDGTLYGTTIRGGASNNGTIFQFNPLNGNLNTRASFMGATNGSVPYSKMMLSSTGKLYGTTWLGGSSDVGVMYEYDPLSNVITKKVDFLGPNGSELQGNGLIEINDTILSTHEIKNPGIVISPNPCRNYLDVKIDGNLKQRMEFNIKDINGNTLYQGTKSINSNQSEFRIDVSFLKEGVYILNLDSQKENHSWRFIKVQ